MCGMLTVLEMVLVMALGATVQAEELDQVNETISGSASLLCCSPLDIVTHQQEITAGLGGHLTQVDFNIGLSSLGSALFFVNRGPAPQRDEHDFEAVLTPGSLGWFSIDVASAGIVLEEGEVFVIGAMGNETTSFELRATGVFDDGYPFGSAWFQREGFMGGEWVETDGGLFDLVFRTYVCVVPPCTADVDGDSDVGFSDLLEIITGWGPCPEGVACPADLDGDGMVGFGDLLDVLTGWGPCAKA